MARKVSPGQRRPTNSSSSEAQILHSWKEISSYTGRGVRTLQRYEANLGFPVHRPLGKPRSSVLAFKHEIDRWLSETPSSALDPLDGDKLAVRGASLRCTRDGLEALYANATKWRTKTSSMQQRVVSMQQAVNSMQEGFNSMLQRLERTQNLIVKSKLHWERTLTRRQRRQAASTTAPNVPKVNSASAG